jgi:hypothetical protein|tara:strand:+ start:6035 stop:6481 length:447 start_codon:yes stop_codon:yes gene_type:complete
MDDKIKELIEDGKWINAEIIIEVQGNDKTHMKDALDKLVERLKKEEKIKVYETTFSDPETLESGLFSQHIDVKLVARDFGKMVYIALMYSPSNFEILSPKNITLPSGEAENILADVSSIVVSLAHSVFAKQGEINRLQGTAPSQKKTE